MLGAQVQRQPNQQDPNYIGEAIPTDRQRANLKGSNLEGACLKGALLQGADLRNVRKLSCKDIESAVVDKTTRLPDTFKIKWTSDTSFECEERKKTSPANG